MTDAMVLAGRVEQPSHPVLLVDGAFAIGMHRSSEFEMEHRPGTSLGGDPSGRVVLCEGCQRFLPVSVNYADLQGLWELASRRGKAVPAMLLA